MEAGELNKRIILQRESWTLDTYNSKVATWTNVATVWAKVKPLQGRELFQAAQVQEEVTHSVTIRYRAGVTADQRISYDSRTLQILGIVNVNEENIWLAMSCVERV